jgi:hypothetical protein
MTPRTKTRILPFLAPLALLAAACGHPKAATDAPRSSSDTGHSEVVRYCSGKESATEALASVGSGCDKSGLSLATQLYEAGVRIGVAQGTQRIHGAAMRTAAEQFATADVAAKIAEKTRKADEQAATDADAEMSRVVEKRTAGSCLTPPAARAIVGKGAACGMAAYETDEYSAEYARAFGYVCEHILSQQECLRRAESEYARMPRSPAGGDGGAY